MQGERALRYGWEFPLRGNADQNNEHIVESGNFTPYIFVESNGGITIFNTKPEMGQGTFQSIPAIIAEEFEVSLDRSPLKIQTGKNNLATASAAGGSASVRTNYTDLRKVGASAKEVFIKAASMKWEVDHRNLLCREW